MKKLSLVLMTSLFFLSSCGEESKEADSKSKKEEKNEQEEVVEEDLSDDGPKPIVYAEYPEAIGECPAGSELTKVECASGLLGDFAEHNLPGNAKFCKAKIAESSLTPGTYSLMIFFSNKDYSIDKMYGGRIGDLDSDEDFIVQFTIKSKGLPMPGVYKVDEEADNQFSGMWIYGKGKSDEKFIRNGLGLDTGSEFTLTSINEGTICGSFNFVGYDAKNKGEGTFSCTWE